MESAKDLLRRRVIFSQLIRACSDLSSSLRTPRSRARATQILGDFLSDVSLPMDPMTLTREQAVALRRSAAKDLAAVLDAFARTDEPFTHAARAQLLETAAPHWRTLAACCWSDVLVQEQRRYANALEVAAAVVDAAFVAGAFGEYRPSPQEFFSRLDEMSLDPDILELSGQIEALLVEHGSSMRHLRTALLALPEVS